MMDGRLTDVAQHSRFEASCQHISGIAITEWYFVSRSRPIPTLLADLLDYRCCEVVGEPDLTEDSCPDKSEESDLQSLGPFDVGPVTAVEYTVSFDPTYPHASAQILVHLSHPSDRKL